MEEKKESKISNIEWGLVIGALLTIDLAQILLDFFAIGAVLNRLIDIFVGLCLGFYLQIRGQSLANPKRLFGLVGIFLGEMLPVVDAFPLWTLDGVFNMFLAKSEKIVGQVPGAKT